MGADEEVGDQVFARALSVTAFLED